LNINTTYTGHNIDILSTFPDRSIDCIITSPPYFQLRDYGTEHQIWGGVDNCPHEFESYEKTIYSGSTKSEIANGQNQITDLKSTSAFCKKCNAWKGELGLEPTFQLYIDHLLSVFEECKRVLKDEGTMWVNLGDSYNNGNGEQTTPTKWKKAGSFNLSKTIRSLQPKCLLNIPSRFAIAMTDELGLILRNNIIWHKNNCMPSSATDRFTVDFENIMFFTKKKKYYFEQQFEKSIDPESYSGRRARTLPRQFHTDKKHFAKAGSYDENGIDRGAGKAYPNRNMRTVWNINTSGSKDKHYAMYPEKLLVRMIEAGCPKEICNKCGKAKQKIVIADYKGANNQHKNTKVHHNGQTHIISRGSSNPKEEIISCNCNAGFHPGIVLDPFGGSGTTGITAKKLQRNFINIELNPEYSEISERNFEIKIGNLF